MRIFIVEDDTWYAQFLKHHISLNPDNEVETFESGKEYKKALKRKPDVVCLDFTLPDSSGEELLKLTKAQSPETEVIIVSGQEDVKTAIGLLKLGAYDYLTKDEETTERIWNLLIKINEKSSLVEEVKTLRQEVKKQYKVDHSFIGESPAIQNVKHLINKATETTLTISITGETGTGKEVVAKSIHYNSNYKGKFVAVNVAAIPKDLIESELFGHEKGAFTGANNKRIGKFEEANEGTLFLDEIGEMDLNMQSKLLRVLQEREVVRVGGNKPIKIKTRIITATHKNLADEVHKGNFRQDLYFRLLGMPIDLPPLRSRGKDIILLADHFLKDFCAKNNLNCKKLSDAAAEKLMSHEFSGNVRELKALMDLAAVMSASETIEPQDINLNVAGKSLDAITDKEMSLKEYNEKIINHYINKYDNNIVLAAKALKIGKSTIYRMLNKNKAL
ncbi:sigma-54-dependent transcriptional regulator [Crocinitomix algicola]|uniref:sigma-54-dependent transcriptional regulator n=1 Tax=Crocinitomix algicola TaxID=1740263 RepID=UPI000832B69E|nr:sigma-54 dependent transcriptional regulator [Crocinitomix algicola]